MGRFVRRVVTSKGITSKNVLDKFKFNFCSSDADDVLKKEDINTVFIATSPMLHMHNLLSKL